MLQRLKFSGIGWDQVHLCYKHSDKLNGHRPTGYWTGFHTFVDKAKHNVGAAANDMNEMRRTNNVVKKMPLFRVR